MAGEAGKAVWEGRQAGWGGRQGGGEQGWVADRVGLGVSGSGQVAGRVGWQWTEYDDIFILR